MQDKTRVENSADPGPTTAHRDIGALEALWALFSSMKTAIVLLLILALGSVAGTVIEQNQPPEVYLKAYGQAGYGLLRALGLTDVYHSAWFTALMALIGVNLAVCSINRFGIAWRRTFRPEVDVTPERVSGMTRSERFELRVSVKDAAAKLTGALRSRGYHVNPSASGDRVSLHASKGRISIWGPYLTHVSILVIFVGAILGGFLGFDGYATIPEGGSISAYYPTGSDEPASLGFEVALDKFSIDHDARRNPTAYKSDLMVRDGGKQVARKVIDVNHPLTYRGVSFYQSDYGLAGVVLKITAANGETETLRFDVTSRSTPQGRVYAIADMPFQQVSLGGKKVTVFVHNLVPDYVGGKRLNASMLPLNPAVNVMINERFPEYKGLDAWKPLGWLTESASASRDGFTVKLEDVVSYTGLQVASNPALPVVYAGFALMIIGVFVSFYVTNRTLRATIDSAGEGAVVTVGAQSRAEPEAFDVDFGRIRETLSE